MESKEWLSLPAFEAGLHLIKMVFQKGTLFDLKFSNINTMTKDVVIYTDGRDITVTPYQFIVGKTEYLLEGITAIRFFTIRGNKIPAILFVLLGIAGVLTGWKQLFSGAINSAQAGAHVVTFNQLAIYGGIILFVLGALWFALIQDKYAVRITTAEGEKDAVVSPKKDYINQIVSALQEAVNNRF